jgi:hypothetical protein
VGWLAVSVPGGAYQRGVDRVEVLQPVAALVEPLEPSLELGGEPAVGVVVEPFAGSALWVQGALIGEVVALEPLLARAEAFVLLATQSVLVRVVLEPNGRDSCGRRDWLAEHFVLAGWLDWACPQCCPVPGVVACPRQVTEEATGSATGLQVLVPARVEGGTHEMSSQRDQRHDRAQSGHWDRWSRPCVIARSGAPVRIQGGAAQRRD